VKIVLRSLPAVPLGVAVWVAVVLAGGVFSAAAAPPPPAPMAGASERMIFAKEAARELWAGQFPPPAMFWTPDINDVLKMERELPAFLRRAVKKVEGAAAKPEPLWKRAPAYQRQYFGMVEKGHWIVYGNFFCDAHGKDWRSQPVLVKDGGDCYFQVRYDPKTSRFFGLSVNGEA